MRSWVCFVACVGCGRIAFDPLASDDASLLTYREAVLQDAPVAYWRLGDTDTVARDETGNLEGTYSGTCVQAAAGALAGDADGALRFPPSTSCRVDFPGQVAFPGRAPFTLEVWVSLDVLGGGQCYFMNEIRNGGLPRDGFAMLEGQAVGTTYFERAGAGTNHVTARSVLVIGQWTHVVGIYDGNAISLVVDGEVVGTSVMAMESLDTTGAVAVIGSYPPGFGMTQPTGILDEIAIYDRALPLERIQLHHAIGVNGPQ